MAYADFLSVCVTPDAPRIKSKSQEVESIVSHPLKLAEGGAASFVVGSGSPTRVGQPRKNLAPWRPSELPSNQKKVPLAEVAGYALGL